MSNLIHVQTLTAILLLVLLQQMFVLGRIWTRFMLWGCAIELDGVLRRGPSPPGEYAPVPAIVVSAPPAPEQSAKADWPPEDYPE